MTDHRAQEADQLRALVAGIFAQAATIGFTAPLTMAEAVICGRRVLELRNSVAASEVGALLVAVYLRSGHSALYQSELTHYVLEFHQTPEG